MEHETFLRGIPYRALFSLLFAFPCINIEVIHSLRFVTVKEKLIMAKRRGKKETCLRDKERRKGLYFQQELS